jgi:hypothetical protein
MPSKEDLHTSNMKLFPHIRDSQGRNMLASHAQLAYPKGIDLWHGYRRLVAKSALPLLTNIPSGAELDFDIITQGALAGLMFEFTVITSDALASTFNPYDIFQRIDLETDSGKLFHQSYPDELWIVNVLQRSLNENNFKKNLEGMQSNYTPNSPSIAAGAGVSTTYLLEYRLFNGSMPDLRSLNQALLMRLYLNPATAFVISGSQNVQLTNFNILLKEVNLPMIRPRQDLWFRYQNFVRNIQTLQMGPSQQYDFQLNTFSGFAAYLFFVIRQSPVSTNAGNAHTYNNNLTSFELRDSSNVIIAINNYPLMNKYWVGQEFQSDFLTYPNNNVFVIPHSTNVLGAEDGQQCGGLQYTTKEILHLETNAAFTAGTWEVAIWASNYEFYSINADGTIMFTK